MYNVCVCVQYKKKNIPSLQVKNKPCVGELEHVFILGSIINMVVNTNDLIDNVAV